MKPSSYVKLPTLGLALVLLAAAAPGRAQEPASSDQPTSNVAKLLRRVKAATTAAKTMTADFAYTVTSIRQQQMVVGKVKMMKPNYARLTFSYMARPAFPNLVASDGENIHTFKPASFLPSRTFAKGPFDPALGALQASGTAPGGGTISTTPVHSNGANIHLWDGIPLQAFFDPEAAIRGYLYLSDLEDLDKEDDQELDGVTYQVLHHHFTGGNIAGGENSDFEQRLYIGPDDLIHMYVLEFTSGGRPGIQVMRLDHIKVNVPMTKEAFAFKPLPSHVQQAEDTESLK